MHAICQSISGQSIPLENRYLGENNETCYSPLKIGQTYSVYAILFISDRVDFLVKAPEQNPLWAPSILFDLVDKKIPENWEICITTSRNDYNELFTAFRISCIIGYPLLTTSYAHYSGLIEGDDYELQRFFLENNKNQI